MHPIIDKRTPVNQRWMDWLFRPLPIPRKFVGKANDRTEQCTVCGSSACMQIGEVDYWDFGKHDIVQCRKCDHIELDPMLTAAETSKGCLAHHIEVSLRESAVTQRNNALRNYRKGMLFAWKLKRFGFTPNTILELGPGSGYFAEGIKYVFPEVSITVLDVVDVVLEDNAKTHGYGTIKGTPEDFVLPDQHFDVIVARDILEHVTDIKKTIENVQKLLQPGGLFHFITPNGHCDVWRHYLRFYFGAGHSELLINHVNYFIGTSLQALLELHDLKPVEYYTFQFKAIRKGGGWSLDLRKASPKSSNRSADAMIEKESEVADASFSKSDITARWYFSKRFSLLTKLVCWYHHYWAFKISPSRNLGHEIHGIFQKNERV